MDTTNFHYQSHIINLLVKRDTYYRVFAPHLHSSYNCIYKYKNRQGINSLADLPSYPTHIASIYKHITENQGEFGAMNVTHLINYYFLSTI